MKISGAAIGLLCVMAVEAAPRDPFLAPVDRCPWAQWEKWRFHGIVGGGTSIKAMIENPDGKWFRASVGQPLTADLRVKAIAVEGMTIATPSACGEGQLYWRLKEEFNDKKDVQIHRTAIAPGKRTGRYASR